MGRAQHVEIVGEIAQGHDGSVDAALHYIDRIADAGADAVKFQTHIAAAESTPSEPWRIKFSTQDATRYDYWKRMEFTEPQWGALRERAVTRGLKFYSSPFSLAAVDLLLRIGVDGFKVASGEIGSTEMIRQMAATGLPLIISTGMSSLSEIDATMSLLSDLGAADVCLLQCTSSYPTEPETLGLNVIDLFRSRYGVKVGLSDHSGTIFAGLAAATVGIDLLEVHVTSDRDQPGPDVSSSVTSQELRQLVDGVRFIEAARAHPVDKDRMAEDLLPMRELFTKSLVAKDALPAGTLLEAEHLVLKKPGTGIPAESLAEVVGRRLVRNVEADDLLSEDDLA